MHDYECGLAFMKTDCGWFVYWRTAKFSPYRNGERHLEWEHSRALFRWPWWHRS